jgi:hypothetical protein
MVDLGCCRHLSHSICVLLHSKWFSVVVVSFLLCLSYYILPRLFDVVKWQFVGGLWVATCAIKHVLPQHIW